MAMLDPSADRMRPAHCEVLLHGLSTLSPMVARAKRAYLWAASNDHRCSRAPAFPASWPSRTNAGERHDRRTAPMRNLVLAFFFTLTCMSHASHAQAQATSPTTTGVMVIVTVKSGVTREQVAAVMPAEIRQTVQLYLNGKIREWYSR